MEELFTLGDIYVSDFIAPGEEPRAGRAELKVMFDEDTQRVSLAEHVDPDFMYGKYWYRSGTNATMTRELKDVVDSIYKVYKLPAKAEDVMWVDIACNDGTLLSHVDAGSLRVGIDPVDDSFKVESEKHANVIVQDFFSKEAWDRGIDPDFKADVITCIAMFYDTPTPDMFLRDVYACLEDDGLFVLQMSYSPLMIEQNAFDNICHEHLYYYTLYTINDLLESNGFQVMDCQLNDVNGGSFRVYAMKSRADVTKFGSQPYRDVCRMRISSLLDHEYYEGYNNKEKWLDFGQAISDLREDVRNFIIEEKAKGKAIWVYGASTKGNTLLQYFGLDNTLIDGAAERQVQKFGLKTVGTNIPIYSDEEMRAANPDYLLVLPWHFISEFVAREQAYLKAGGKFIVPCPKFEVIGWTE